MIVEATKDAIDQAGLELAQGKLVAFPTETVYGLGADARNATAVAAIYALKQRPEFNPLIIHVDGLETARRHGAFSPLAEHLAETFWPGPLTIIVTRREESDIALLASAGLDTIALRAPAHPVAQQLLAAARCPIAAPSANASGYVSPTRAEHVQHDLDEGPAVILTGGPHPGGLESTVIDTTCEPPALLRPGALTIEDIERETGIELAADGEETIRSPGQLASHYAPHARVRLDATDLKRGEALLAFGPNAPVGAATAINLSPAGNLQEAAANLFDALRELDQKAPAPSP